MIRTALILLAAALAAGPAGATAPACWDYGAGGWDPVGAVPGPEPVRAVALTADGRLLGGYDQGVGILALDDPTRPVFTGFLPTGAPVVDLAVSGDRFVALTEAGVLWYGLLTAGLEPAWGDSLLFEEEVTDVGLDRGTAVAVIGRRGILAIDVSDPKLLRPGGFALPPTGINAVTVDRGLAYLGTDLDRFYVYDVSDPESVVFVGSPREGLASCIDLTLRYPVLYAAIGGSVYVYDVSDPAAGVRTGRSDGISAYITGIDAGKDRVFALTEAGQAVMYRDEGPERLALLGHAALPADGAGLAAVGDHLYVAVEGAPGVILDTTTARHPGFDRRALPWKIEAADFGGSHGYAITTDGLASHRLEVYDFAGTDTVVTTVATLPTVGVAVDLAVAGGLLAFASSSTDLTLVDVSDPAAPTYLAITATQTFPRGLLLINQGAFLANNSQGLVSYDVSDPTRPRLVRQTELPRTQVAWARSGDNALVGMIGDLNGMFVVGCRTPEETRILSWVSVPAPVTDVVGTASHAYVADADGHVHVFDLADPTDPRPAAVVPAGEMGGRLAVYGRHLYWVDSKQGVVVFDLGDAGAPALVGRSLVPLAWSRLAARASGLYLPVDYAISRLPLPCDALSAAPPAPPAPARLAAAPNPFNPRTVLSFGLPAAASCRLTVHDLRGRLVATLLDGRVLPAGPHEAVWDGRDAAGRAAASGVYLARLAAGGTRATARLTLVR